MQRRRSVRLVAGALVLAAPLLSSCGFGKATDRVYTPAEGTNERSQDIKVLSAVVVSGQPDSGTFIATLSNNVDEGQDPTTFDSLAGSGEWTDLQIGDFDPVDVPVRGFTNLADGGGVPIDGDFMPGDFMSLTLTFGNGQTTTMGVPVVYACDEWSGLDTSASTSSSASSSPSASVSPGDVPTDSSSAEVSDDATDATGSEPEQSTNEETPIVPESVSPSATASPSGSSSSESSSESASASSGSSAQAYDCSSVLEEQ